MRTNIILLSLSLTLGVVSCRVPDAGGGAQGALFGDDAGVQFQNVPNNDPDPFHVVTGQPSVSARMHSCQRVPYSTLGAILTSRGVNLAAVAPAGKLPTAGMLYKNSALTLGAPNYATRTREGTQQTTSGATKLIDLFMMAAPEIISAMPGLKACQINGAPTQMFDPKTGDCTAEGILCLTGQPAVQGQIDLCNQMLKDIPDAKGRQIAVATILSAAHTCE